MGGLLEILLSQAKHANICKKIPKFSVLSSIEWKYRYSKKKPPKNPSGTQFFFAVLLDVTYNFGLRYFYSITLIVPHFYWLLQEKPVNKRAM